MRLLLLAVGVWVVVIGILVPAGLFAVLRWRRRSTLRESPVSDRWLADHVNDKSGDRT